MSWSSEPPPNQMQPGPVPQGPTQPVWPQPPAARPRSINAFGVVTVALLGLWCVAEIALVVQSFAEYSLLGEIIADPGSVTDAEAATNDQVSLVTSVLSLLVLGAAAVSFVCWLWRARLNAEAFLPLRHRRSRVWVILGWFVPIVSLWFPKQVVDDVWRTSDPGRPPHESGLKFAKPTGLVTAWWVSFLAYSIGGNISLRAWLQAEDAEQFQFANTVDIALGPIGLAAAILAIVIVRRITAMQEASLGAQIG